MGNRQAFLVKSIVETCQIIYTKGWVANHDGNVSARFEKSLLATPTAVSKGDMNGEMILTLDMEGNKLQGVGKPFSEIKLHLAAYRARPDIHAVVHAHPPFAMARGLGGSDFEVTIPEAVVSIGDAIPVVPYRLPGHPDHDSLVAGALARVDVFMMAGNGVLSVGRDVKEAFLRMELLEHILKIDYYARSMDSRTPLTIPPEDRRKLLEKRAAAGLGPPDSHTPSLSGEKDNQAPPSSQADLIRDLIAREIKKVILEKP